MATLLLDPSQFADPAQKPVRVLLVDDHAPTLAAVASLIDQESPHFHVAGTARNGGEALRLAVASAPDVIVLDLDLGGEYGLDLLPRFAQITAAVVVVLTASDDAAERARAYAAGACAFVNKLAPASELIAAIEATRSITKVVVEMSRPGKDRLPSKVG